MPKDKPSGWSRESRHKRGYGSAWDKRRAEALERDGHCCVKCRAEGRDVPATNVDHITPKSRRGTDALSNLQSLCDRHRAIKDREDRGGTFKAPIRRDDDGWPILD